jgi:hypothetical protein
MHLQIRRAALPYPSTLSSGMEYYGLKRWVARFLTLKEFTIPASPIKAGSVLLTSNVPLVVMKLNTRDAILSSDFPDHDLSRDFYYSWVFNWKV